MSEQPSQQPPLSTSPRKFDVRSLWLISSILFEIDSRKVLRVECQPMTIRTSLAHRACAVLLSLLACGCAGTQVAPSQAGVGAGARRPRVWPAEPDARAQKLLAAAGDDAIALAMIHADAWRGFRRMLLAADSGTGLAKSLPWLNSDELWLPLAAMLGIDDSKLPQRQPAGWDVSRPLVVALLGTESRGLLATLAARTLDWDDWLVHLRILVPASDAGVLARGFMDAFAAVQREEGAPGRYVIRTRYEYLGVAVLPAGDHVRLELLYAYNPGSTIKVIRRLPAWLDGMVQPPRPRATDASTDAITRLLPAGRGLALSLRPNDLARWILIASPKKMRDQLSTIPPDLAAGYQAAGIGELLLGYLVTSASQPEIEELALVAEIDSAIRVASLARLTATGQRQMAAFVGKATTTVATSPTALASIAMATAGGAGVKGSAPLYGPAFRVKTLHEISRHIQHAGVPAGLALLSRPVALYRALFEEKQIAGDEAAQAVAPADIAFELLDLDAQNRETYRVSARLPGTGAGTVHWLRLARELSEELGRGRASDVAEHRRPDGTWITWMVSPASKPRTALLGGRTALPLGTFLTSRIRPATMVEPPATRAVDWRNEEEVFLRKLVRQIVDVGVSWRWQDGWLIGQASATLAGQPEPEAFAPPSPSPSSRAVGGEPAKGLLPLQRVASAASQFLEVMGNLPGGQRLELFAQVRKEAQSDLALAKQDPVVRGEAEALDRLLLAVRKAFEEGMELAAKRRAGKSRADGEEEESEAASAPASSPTKQQNKDKRKP
jgi:hypothetical protein